MSSGSLAFPRPFIWTAQTGKAILQEANGNTVGSANAITPDGTVIVGQSAGRAVRWVENQVQNLGTLPGGNPQSTYWALAVTVDGNAVYGVGNFNATQGSGEAFLWDATHGMRSPRQVLITEHGLDLSGWGLFAVMDVSDDGRTTVGYGIGPGGYQEAWLVRLPSSVGDLNCDGQVNFDDISPFVLALSDPQSYPTQYPNCHILNGDCDNDGDVDFDDINPLVALLAGG